ncbi:MAG TPA: hypothetical protein VGA56_06860 [Opitutaceae bacterium]
MHDPGSPGGVEIEIVPASDSLRSNDGRWLKQVGSLLADLRRNEIEIRKEITPAEGKKGGAEAIILALDSSGAITAAVTIFKAWLSRSEDRSIKVKGRVGDREVELVVTGRNISEQTLQMALGLGKG